MKTIREEKHETPVHGEYIAQGTKSEKRRKAPYKLLYNNDTTNTAGVESPFHKKGEPFTEKKLVASIDEVAGKAVDCYLLSPGMGWVPWWQSTVDPDYFQWWEKWSGLEVMGARSGSGYEKYVYDGGDMVQVLIDTCKKHNMDPFVSLRLNDVHAQENYVKKDQRSLNSCRLYIEHPEWHIDPEHYKREGYYGQRGMDWAIPEVREYKLALLVELAEKYDLAGLELDFLRHSKLFRDNGPSDSERIRIITGFISEVRKALDKRKGKRRWLSVRIPLELSAHPALGLDVKKLYNAGVDIFNLSGWYNTTQNTDCEEVRRRVPEAAIYVEMTYTTGRNPYFHKKENLYGCISNPRTSDHQYYTTSRIAYERGADGMSLFNFVYYRSSKKGFIEYSEPPFHVMPKLIDRKFLSDRNPYYYLANATYSGQIPRVLKKGGKELFKLDMVPEKKNTTLRLRIHTKEIIGDRKITLQVNGKQLEPVENVSAFYDNPYDWMITPDEEHKRAWSFSSDTLTNGLNNIGIGLESGEPLTIIWIDVGI